MFPTATGAKLANEIAAASQDGRRSGPASPLSSVEPSFDAMHPPNCGNTQCGCFLDAVLNQGIDAHLQAVDLLRQQAVTLKWIAALMTETIRHGGKVLWCGNGGSAADCQHLAAEFVGRFQRERRAYASIALTTDSSILTAIANDYSFHEIFRRQVQALCCAGDVVVGISTSGNSENVHAGLTEAKKRGGFAVCFTGSDGGRIAEISDAALFVASKDTARIQEVHILAGHLLCDCVERALCVRSAGSETKTADSPDSEKKDVLDKHR